MKIKILLILLLTISMAFCQGRGGGRQMTWDESLNLTTEQMQQITELRENMQPAMQSMRQSTRDLQVELRNLLRADGADEARIAELESIISANELAMNALMEGHRDQIRELLTDDQRMIFDQHEFRPMGGRRPGPNQPGGDRPRGPMGNRPRHGRR